MLRLLELHTNACDLAVEQALLSLQLACATTLANGNSAGAAVGAVMGATSLGYTFIIQARCSHTRTLTHTVSVGRYLEHPLLESSSSMATWPSYPSLERYWSLWRVVCKIVDGRLGCERVIAASARAIESRCFLLQVRAPRRSASGCVDWFKLYHEPHCPPQLPSRYPVPLPRLRDAFSSCEGTKLCALAQLLCSAGSYS